MTERAAVRIASEAAAKQARRAAERERRERERFEFLAEINEALADASDRRAIMTAVTRAAVPRLGDMCSIYVFPEHGDLIPEVETFHVDPDMQHFVEELRNRFPYDPAAPTGMPAVLRTGAPEYFFDLTPEALDNTLRRAGFADDDDAKAAVDQLQLRSLISVPLIKDGRVLGGLSFAIATSSRRFDEQDLALAEVIAGRVASSVENRRLADRQRHIAKTLQASLLPRALPVIGGLDVAVRYWAAGEGTDVGGDFYDVFATTPDTWIAVIGDVCGTGPTAAALTSLARHTIRQAASDGHDPAGVIEALNRAFLDAVEPQGSFLTAAVVELTRTEAGFDARLVLAGHPHPVLRATNGDARLIGTPGKPVGMFDRISATTERIQLHRGDTVVLYTDGVTDVAPPYGLGADQVKDLVSDAAVAASDANRVLDNIHAAIERILPIADRDDDIALLALKLTGP